VHHPDRHSFPTRRSSDLGQRVPGGKILTIPNYRPQRLRHRPDACLSSDQILVNAIAFERGVQPLAPRGVAVAVAQKRTILKWDRSEEHTSELQSPDHLVC